MWAMRKVEVMPDVVGAIPKGLNKSLQNIGYKGKTRARAEGRITRNCKNSTKSP